MLYGNMEVARKYCNEGKVEEWIQLFLRNDGHNVVLADGLLKDKRYYTDIVDIDIELLKDIENGAPDYLTKENDIAYFFSIVDRMKENVNEWNPPPMIIEYQGDMHFYVCDGRHRLEMYRQNGIKKIPAILWTSGQDKYDEMKGAIKC